jgi:hypothetical protein
MALNAEERLITIRVKIKRAKKHLAELEEAAGSYRDAYSQVPLPNQSIGTSGGVPQFIRLPIIHFDMLAIAGDVLHNLRSSLDHVVYNLALIANPNASEDILRKVEFPIGESLEKYETLRRRKIEGVIEPRTIKFIDGLKPYKGGNDVLWKLHETNNIDKHRNLVRVGVDILCDGDGFDGYYLLKANAPPFTGVYADRREQDAKLPAVGGVVQAHIGEGEALIPTLHYLVDFVEGLVESFRPFLE